MSESERLKDEKSDDFTPKPTDPESSNSNSSESRIENSRFQFQQQTFSRNASYIQSSSINNPSYLNVNVNVNVNVNEIFFNTTTNYSTSYDYSHRSRQPYPYDAYFDFRSSRSRSYPQSYLPHRRKWEHTEYGRAWYETIQQPDKLQKTQSEASKSTASNKQHHIREFTFKLSTYNLLAPNLLEDNIYLYERINPLYLDWNYRKRKIMEEIESIDSDIWCFQEMEENQYFQYFLPKLANLGYACYFKKRIGDKRDGCVICFKTKKFQLVKEEQVEYNIPGVEVLNRENIALILLLKVKPRTNQTTESNNEKYLCVATTHLLFNPRRGDCKLAQIQVFLANLDRIAYRKSKWVNNKLKTYYHPIIFCGDLNLTNQSVLYQYLSEAKLENYKEMNYIRLSGQFQASSVREAKPIGETILPETVGITDQSQFKKEVEERLVKAASIGNREIDKTPEYTFGDSCLTHNFKFKSVYEHLTETGTREVTTIVRSCKETVDFIFYHSLSSDEEESDGDEKTDECNRDETESDAKVTEQAKGLNISSAKKRTINKIDRIRSSSSLKLISRLKLFSNDIVYDYCIPNRNYPSDHFMLVAKFSLT